jgi:hypothetical protein
MEIDLQESADLRDILLIRKKRELEDTLDNRLEEFSKLFVSNFIKVLQIYCHEARNEGAKTGKTAELGNPAGPISLVFYI